MFLRQLFWNGFDGVNPEFTRIFQAMAKSANSVIDLGSYLGYYSLIAAKMNPSARVFSVEPLPDSIAYQKQLFKFNGADNVQICPVGVAMKSATVPFYVPDRSLSRIPNIGSLTNRNGPGTFYEDRGSDTIHTEVLTLPDLVQKYEIPQIELIKFFVEEMEVDIFAGGKSILGNWNPDLRDFERYIAVKNFPTIRALREVPGFDRWASRNFAPTRRRLEFEVPVFEFEGVMTGHRLPSTDAGSMRASMGFRTPFLSRAMQETIAEFDPLALMKFGQKSVFRRLLKRYLPDQMVDLPKRGFVFPSDRFEWVGRDRAPPTKLVPRELVEQIWRNRSKPGWRALATRIAMLSEFENWVPGRLPQNPGQTKPAEPAASAAS